MLMQPVHHFELHDLAKHWIKWAWFMMHTNVKFFDEFVTNFHFSRLTFLTLKTIALIILKIQCFFTTLHLTLLFPVRTFPAIFSKVFVGSQSNPPLVYGGERTDPLHHMHSKIKR
jgi:hypothetical protein